MLRICQDRVWAVRWCVIWKLQVVWESLKESMKHEWQARCNADLGHRKTNNQAKPNQAKPSQAKPEKHRSSATRERTSAVSDCPERVRPSSAFWSFSMVSRPSPTFSRPSPTSDGATPWGRLGAFLLFGAIVGRLAGHTLLIGGALQGTLC